MSGKVATCGGGPVKKVPIHLQSSQNRLILRNGRIVNADSATDGDVFIEDGKIKDIGRNLIIPGGTRNVDCRGLVITPGGVDPNVNFSVSVNGIKSVDDFYNGTKAAIAGGTTCIIANVVPETGESLLDAYARFRTMAEGQVCCDYSLRVVITWWSEKLKGEMESLVRDNGVSSFRIVPSGLKDTELYVILDHCKRLGVIATIVPVCDELVAENAKRVIAAGVTGPEGISLSSSPDIEAAATLKACMLGSQTGCPIYISPVMSKGAADIIASKRINGCIVYGEPIAASLGTDGSSYMQSSWRHAAAHVANPPLQNDTETPEYLMNMVARDDLSVIGSDNLTFTHAQKKAGTQDFRQIPPGVNGVEDRMSIVWQKGVQEGRMDPTRFVAATSATAAKIFNLYPQKGCIEIGADADLVVWNPRKSRQISAKSHHHNTDNNIFEGITCFGVPEYVVCNGRICFDEGQVKVLQGYGKFVSVAPFSPLVYDMVKEADKRKADLLKPVARDGFDGEMLNKVQNGVSAVKIDTDAPSALSRPSSGYSHPASPQPSLPPPTPVDESQIKSPIRNMQESTLDKEPAEAKTQVRVRQPPGGRSSGLW